MSNDKNLDKFLPPEDKNADNDYNYSRSTYYELVEKGKESLELMIEVARESEHPRAFEVLSGMIKNISDVNDRLMDLNKKKKDLDKSTKISSLDEDLRKADEKIINKKIDKQYTSIKESESNKEIKILQNKKPKSNFI